MATNFFGALYTTYAALPYLLSKREGAIVNISSIGGKVAVPHLLPYTASKFALTGVLRGTSRRGSPERDCRHHRLSGIDAYGRGGACSLCRAGGQREGLVFRRRHEPRYSLRTFIKRRIASFMRFDCGRAELTITPQAWLAARFAGCAPETTALVSGLIHAYLLPSAVIAGPV